ncbi:transposase [Microvirga arsenatis]|uniref:DUF1611 domain-containing protein n=1 Tax=Microvirga arsenatis TaxID=2692265 RepID=A0ABW9YS48_9HYPH|nr:transposase [Microvirga arsenatis]NBJ10055.1 DUF1611 domain-containing protein [Microvirga arsenatis]NBJ23123.1 DUF1611 domain-containing protein [Microvirga arsenatis]
MAVQRLSVDRVASAKRAYTTRRVNPEAMSTLITDPTHAPTSGDLVLARIDELGKQRRIELTTGRRAHLFPGDEVIVCYGNRYAPDQFEAEIGEDLSSCDLVAAGGIASCELSRNERMIPSTRISPIGLIGDTKGKRLNLKDFAVQASGPVAPMKVVLSLGTSMNAGKTFTSTSLVRGLKASGIRVAAIKATGTGAGNDLWIVRDAGADVVLDFTDGGLASTYLIPLEEIIGSTNRLIRSAAQQGCEVAVVEVADGLQHLETSEVVQAQDLWSDCVGVVFAAYDSMGAKCGVDMLRAAGHRVFAISGRLTQSPLMVREAERSTGVRVYTPWEIQDGALTPLIMNSAVVDKDLEARGTRTHLAKRGDDLPSDAYRIRVMVDEPTFRPLVAKPAHEGDVCELLKTLAEKVMTLEITNICGAKVRERCPSRTNHRSGYRRRYWDTGMGRIELNVPRIRKGTYHPEFLHSITIPRGDLALLVGQAVALDATPFDLARLLDRIGVTQLPPDSVLALSMEVKQKAQQVGLLRLRRKPTLLVNQEDPHSLPYRRTIKDEYGMIGGYGGDTDEMDPFVRVETMPINRNRGTSGLG